MVRPAAAGAHPSLHAQPPARRNRAGQRGRFPALPVRLARRRPSRISWPASTGCAARLSHARRRRVAARAAWERAVLPARARSLRARMARHAVPDGRSRVGAAERRRPRGVQARPALRVALFLREHAAALARAAPGDAVGLRTQRWRRTAAASSRRCAPAGLRSLSELVEACALDEAAVGDGARRARRPRVLPPPTDSPASAPSCAPLRRQPPARLRRADGAGRWSAVQRAVPDAGARGGHRDAGAGAARAATAWCSAACSRAKRTPRRGAR